MIADKLFAIRRDDQDRPQKAQGFETQSIRSLHQYGFLKAVFAVRSGIIDLCQCLYRTKLLNALRHGLDELASIPFGRRQFGLRRRSYCGTAGESESSGKN